MEIHPKVRIVYNHFLEIQHWKGDLFHLYMSKDEVRVVFSNVFKKSLWVQEGGYLDLQYTISFPPHVSGICLEPGINEPIQFFA